ncbi:hypothetical protein BSKO_14130 [Bryopsis sp. KO-2023]|nr:hypothetical protein BSKO_14130 [Bryopsis sp. KO-2023]
MTMARTRKDAVEEHYFKQMLQAVGGPDLPPPEFFCPIALEIMRDPVVLVETAVTYDRSSLDAWLYTYGNDTCLVSRKQLVDPKYVENKVAKSLIDDWLRTHDYKKRRGVTSMHNARPPHPAIQRGAAFQTHADEPRAGSAGRTMPPIPTLPYCKTMRRRRR